MKNLPKHNETNENFHIPNQLEGSGKQHSHIYVAPQKLTQTQKPCEQVDFEYIKINQNPFQTAKYQCYCWILSVKKLRTWQLTSNRFHLCRAKASHWALASAKLPQ